MRRVLEQNGKVVLGDLDIATLRCRRCLARILDRNLHIPIASIALGIGGVQPGSARRTSAGLSPGGPYWDNPFVNPLRLLRPATHPRPIVTRFARQSTDRPGWHA